MRRLSRLGLSAAVALAVAAPAFAADEPPVPLRRGDRIVFLGDSITEAGAKPNGYVSLIKAALQERNKKLAESDRAPILVVDGDPAESRKAPKGDVFWLEIALEAGGSCAANYCTVEELDSINPECYDALLLVNVPEIKSEAAWKKLQDYAGKGGSVAFFLGDKVRPEFYNDVLFKKTENDAHQHLFPVLLDPVLPDPPTKEETEDRIKSDKQPQLLFPSPHHPLLCGRPASDGEDEPGGVVRMGTLLRYLLIARYYHTLPRPKWDPDQSEDVRVVVAQPNRRPPNDYGTRVKDLLSQIDDRLKAVADAEPKAEKYRRGFALHQRKVRDALSSKSLYPLTTALDDLLHDPGDPTDPDHPRLEIVWGFSRELAKLARDVEALRKETQFGDPLVVTRRYGKGRVVAFLTSAGTASGWNEWASGAAQVTYPVFMKDLTRHLVRETQAHNAAFGTGFPAERVFEVIGAGVSGNKVPDIQGRLEKDVLAKKPTVVVIYIGINDVWHGEKDPAKGTPKDKYEAGLRDVIGRCQDAKARVILCTPSVIGEKADGSNTNDAKLDEYADVSRKVAADMKVPVCDLRKEFIARLKKDNADNKEKGVLTGDGVHLNDAGNRFVADTILKLFGV